jgi:bacillithiol biosynthesis deacetylase BshB1
MARTRPSAVDLLAIAAHPDDAELTCGGTLAKAARAGYRVGILDLVAGESGTSGSAERRLQEAVRAAAALGVHEHLHNTDDTRRVVVEWIRHYRPRTVILPFPIGRHPDHRIASELARDACYLAGLKRYDANGRPYRPFKILYALAYREDPVKPTFVVDVSATFKAKMKAIHCYKSQFDGAKQAGEIFPTGQGLYERVERQAEHYGSLIRTRYGEPFFTHETVDVEDVVAMGVQSM